MAARGTGGKQVQYLTPLPTPPNCLLRDELALPDRYVPPAWAEEVVAEWKKAAELRAVEAYPTQSAMVSGPSGVGKTTASRWIAKQLNLPVFSLSLASAVESYMGATGSNLDKAIRFGISAPMVLIIDELDSVAADRSAKRDDVGEIWRITNTLIQALDHWHAVERSSFLMATTNMPSSVDGAIRRRFEIEVAVNYPDSRELSKIAGVALPMNLRISHAALRRMVLQAKRASVMQGADYALTLMAMVANMEEKQEAQS
jgi:SpoVK/Ycf46/Vps4 family AAA+-type ATPase